ncbi:MAG: hypothetical protein K2M42_07510, partial [Oscillospiraceae bacterium]|nr:hypothetical protein [Oscillospiraceae bacterium]
MAIMKLGSKEVGSTVKLNVGGVAREFLVVHQGLPGTMYDASCDGTWLLMKDIYENRKWHSSDINAYDKSDINAYLNGEFLNKFDADIRSQIKSVKIPYYNRNSGSVYAGAAGCLVKIFLLDAREIGFDHDYAPANEGKTLTYFHGCIAIGKDSRRIALLDGVAARWFLRTPYAPGVQRSESAFTVEADGHHGGCQCSAVALGIRPAMILPADLWVTDDGTITTDTAPT